MSSDMPPLRRYDAATDVAYIATPRRLLMLMLRFRCHDAMPLLC